MRNGQSVSTDRLVDEVWDGEPPSTARKTLQGYVHHLRRVVGDTIHSDGHGYRLELGSAFFDAQEFEDPLTDYRLSRTQRLDLQAAVTATESGSR